jgi:hypothetical protein
MDAATGGSGGGIELTVGGGNTGSSGKVRARRVLELMAWVAAWRCLLV